jgi:hypothetical protein
MQLETQGSVAVGHPVDVASGTLFHEFTDALWPGHVPLAFRRRYSTALLGRAGGMFGQGWSSPLEMTLTRDIDGYVMTGEDGETRVAFDLGEHDLRPGEVLRNPGAFAELRREGSAYVVTRWKPDVDDVVLYVFKGGQNDGPSHLSSMATPDGHGIDIDRDSQGRVATIRQRREKRGLQLPTRRETRVRPGAHPVGSSSSTGMTRTAGFLR